MTCDSNRPCNRCIKRNLQDTCEDAPRKRKKYLSDVPVDILQPRNKSGSPPVDDFVNTMPKQVSPPTDTTSSTSPLPRMQVSQSVPNGMQNISEQITTNNSSSVPISHRQYDHEPVKRNKFMSSAAGLEYSTLSSIISDNFLSGEPTPTSVLSPEVSPLVNQTDPASPNTAINNAFLIQKYQNPYSLVISDYDSKGSIPANHHINSSDHQYSHYKKNIKYDEALNLYYLGSNDEPSDHFTVFPDILEEIEMLKERDPSTFFEKNNKLTLSVVVGVLPDETTYTYTDDPETGPVYIKEPEDIYEKVKKPYSYTPGYHSLIAYLRKRFNKEMLVKMAQTMATYRPSFIACTNSLKEHDLIFMEQCFQRTLLTYDSIIRVSGTPTIVWRRTGEIAYVGNEFCILTGYSRQELLSTKKTLIVELLDDKSVLEYFQLFLKIAFGDFLGATMTECTLLAKLENRRIKTRCLWTLKRDVFGIPMMIIGSFLPII